MCWTLLLLTTHYIWSKSVMKDIQALLAFTGDLCRLLLACFDKPCIYRVYQIIRTHMYVSGYIVSMIVVFHVHFAYFIIQNASKVTETACNIHEGYNHTEFKSCVGLILRLVEVILYSVTRLKLPCKELFCVWKRSEYFCI